jgi:hypothetical protein
VYIFFLATTVHTGHVCSHKRAMSPGRDLRQDQGFVQDLVECYRTEGCTSTTPHSLPSFRHRTDGVSGYSELHCGALRILALALGPRI